MRRQVLRPPVRALSATVPGAEPRLEAAVGGCRVGAGRRRAGTILRCGYLVLVRTRAGVPRDWSGGAGGSRYRGGSGRETTLGGLRSLRPRLACALALSDAEGTSHHQHALDGRRVGIGTFIGTVPNLGT